MLMKIKIPSSSLIEVVVATAIVSICIGIASLVFIRTTKTYTSFENTRKQTEIESAIWNSLYNDQPVVEQQGVMVETSELNTSVKSVLFRSEQGVELFRCDLKNEE